VRRPALLAVAAAVAIVTVLPAPGAATPIDDKRAEAARIQDQLDALNVQLSQRDEEVNQAQIALAAATAELESARQRVAATQVQRDDARTAFEERAAELYVGASSPNPVTMLEDGTSNDFGARLVYGGILADDHLGDVDQLGVLEEDLQLQSDALARAEQDAAGRLTAVQDAQAELQRLVGAQQAVLEQVQGELARLVAEEEARRRAEEERRAREEYARQLAAEQERQRQQAEARRQQAAAQEEARRRSEQTRQDTTTPAPAPPAAAPAPEAAPAPPAPPPAPPAPSGGNSAVVEAARRYLGVPYRYGGSGPDDFDCSGFTAYVYREFGVSLPHSAEMQYRMLPKVDRADLQAGDLVFFGNPIHHVGIYVGDGKMIDAPHTGTVVQYRNMLRNDYAGGARP
jgi:cell wall-associated NlpC family hydrolase